MMMSCQNAFRQRRRSVYAASVVSKNKGYGGDWYLHTAAILSGSDDDGSPMALKKQK